MSDSAKIFTTGSTQGNKNSALRIFVKLQFLQKREIPRVCAFGPNVTPFLALKKVAKFKKKKNIGGKNSPIGLSKENGNGENTLLVLPSKLHWLIYEELHIKM